MVSAHTERAKLMTTRSPLQEEPDFSLVLGGQSYQFLRRAHLSEPALEQVPRRNLFTALITWLPLALLTLIEWNPSCVELTFLHDIEAHVRFLVAVKDDDLKQVTTGWIHQH
jgi:hypothetical protein